MNEIEDIITGVGYRCELLQWCGSTLWSLMEQIPADRFPDTIRTLKLTTMIGDRPLSVDAMGVWNSAIEAACIEIRSLVQFLGYGRDQNRLKKSPPKGNADIESLGLSKPATIQELLVPAQRSKMDEREIEEMLAHCYQVADEGIAHISKKPDRGRADALYVARGAFLMNWLVCGYIFAKMPHVSCPAAHDHW